MNYKEVLEKIKPNVTNIKNYIEEADNIDKELSEIMTDIRAYQELGGLENEISRANNRIAYLNNQKAKVNNKKVTEVETTRKIIKTAKKIYAGKMKAYTKELNYREETIVKLKERMITLKHDGKMRKYNAINEYMKKVIEEKKLIARKRNEVFKNFKDESGKYDFLEKSLEMDDDFKFRLSIAELMQYLEEKVGEKELEQEEPAQEEPVQEEPVQEEPVQEEPVQEEPVQSGPVRQIIRPEPVQIQEAPVQQAPVKEIIKPGNDIKFEDVYSDAKPRGNYNIEVEEEEEIEKSGVDGILVTLAKEGFVMAYAFENSFENDEVDYDEAVKNKIVSYNSISLDKGFDLNIAGLLIDLARENRIDKEIYESYVDGILKDTEIPFWITYDLTDIYKSNLSTKEISNLFKIAKQAQKINPAIEVRKDNILKRALGRMGRVVNPVIDKVKSLMPSKKLEMLNKGNDSIVKTERKQERNFVDTYSQDVQALGAMINEAKSVNEIELLLQASNTFIESLEEKDKKYIDNIVSNAKGNLAREENSRDNLQSSNEISNETNPIKKFEEEHGITVEDVEVEL